MSPECLNESRNSLQPKRPILFEPMPFSFQTSYKTRHEFTQSKHSNLKFPCDKMMFKEKSETLVNMLVSHYCIELVLFGWII